MAQSDNTGEILKSFEQARESLPGTWLAETRTDAIGRFRSFQVSLKNPGAGIVWVITCGFTTPNPPSGASETCKTVVRSSQLLKKD